MFQATTAVTYLFDRLSMTNRIQYGIVLRAMIRPSLADSIRELESHEQKILLTHIRRISIRENVTNSIQLFQQQKQGDDMNVIGKFLEAIWARIASKETPFLLGEAEALYGLGLATTKVFFDSTLSSDEKKELYGDAATALQTVVKAAEAQGAVIANETVSILTGALSDELGTAFGFGK